MLRVLRKQLLLQCIDPVEIALAVQIRSLLHGCERSPALRIDDIRILEGLGHAVDLREAAAALLRVFARDLLALRENIISFRMRKHDIHAEAGHQADHALRNGQRLSVAGRICPGHGKLFALQVLNAAKVMNDLLHVGKALRRMVNVTLQVDERRLLLQDSVLVSLRHRVHEGFLVSMTLSDIHVIPDSDDIRHKGNHVRGFSHCFAMRDLALLLIQILYLQSEQVAGRAEGKPGSGGVVAEHGDAESGVEDLRGNILLSQMSEGIRHSEDGHDLIVCLIPGKEEIILIHVAELQRIKLVNKCL